MNARKAPVKVLETVTDYTRYYALPAPLHPLLTVLALQGLHGPDPLEMPEAVFTPVVQQCYMISLKQGLGRAALRYGHTSYDFNEGVMSFLAPGQGCWLANAIDSEELVQILRTLSGWSLLFHPDLIARYALGEKIARYGFFSYETNEALHLSAAEEATMNQLVGNIRTEAARPVDDFSQDVLVAHIELLLTYSDRFYHRQFLTRRDAGHGRNEGALISKFEKLLAGFMARGDGQPVPGVKLLAQELNVSPAYLSDMLRTLTGQSTLQHIHNALIEKAKRMLLASTASVSETAYQLGFEYPHYFSRLFKKRTGMTPAEFRLSMQ